MQSKLESDLDSNRSEQLHQKRKQTNKCTRANTDLDLESRERENLEAEEKRGG